jgi:hypothetical protein
MANVSARAVWKTAPRGSGSYIIADGVTVYEGMLAGLVSGYLNHWDDGSTSTFLGQIQGGDDRARDGVIIGETSDTPPPEARVDESGVKLMHLTVLGTPTQAKVGNKVYCATSNIADITLNSSGKNHAIGIMTRYRSSTDQDVRLFTPTEFMAQ